VAAEAAGMRGTASRGVKVLAAALLALALHVDAAGAAPPSDPVRSLTGDSPLCAQNLDTASRAACQSSGAVEHPYPLDRYQFDWHITTGITHIENNLLSAVEWVASLVWFCVLYAVDGVLLAFQWAFSLDLLGRSMSGVRAAMGRLHTTTLGQPWFLAALSTLGLWGIWRGFVQRRTSETAVGLLAALALMGGALALINRPDQTVGELSRLANASSIDFLAGAASGTVSSPSRTLAGASRALFDTVVLRPWCALQFADVRWCLARASGDTLTRAERWLRYPKGSKQRDAEYQILADPTSEPWKRSLLGCDVCAADDADLRRQLAGYHPTAADSTHVAIQTKAMVVVRVGLLAVVVAGMAGCVLLVGWLALAVLQQGLLALVLLLAAPVALFAPAFGETGRRWFGGWALRLAGAVIAKALYALGLAIVLSVDSVIGELDGAVPWFVAWGVQLVFFWGVFLRRRQLLAFAGLRSSGHAGLVVLPGPRRAARGRVAGSLPARIASAPVRRVAAGAAIGAGVMRARREDERRAVQGLAREQLEQRARTRLEERYEQTAHRLRAHDDARTKLGEIRPKLRDYDRRRTTVAPGETVQASAAERRLIAQRRALETRVLPRAEEGVARRFVEDADRGKLERGQRFSDQQVDAQIGELRREITQAPQPHRRGGAAPEPGDGTQHAERDVSHDAGLADDLRRDRALLAALPEDGVADARAHRAAKALLPLEQVRTRRREERRKRRRQQRVEPPGLR
jgi:hypothetical protein